LDDVLVQTDGNIGLRTGLQRARSSHRCFGICAPHGARARDVHGLPCRMSDVAGANPATCQSLGGNASVTQSTCHDRDRQRRSAGRVGCCGSAPPSHWPDGQGDVCRREGACGIISLRKTSDPILRRLGMELESTPPGYGETHSKGALTFVRRPESAGRQLHRCLSRWSLFRNRVH